MLIALTGTPGTGKTTIAKQLKKTYRIIELNTLIKQRGLYTQVDQVRECLVADLEEVQRQVAGCVQPESVNLVEGHFSHELSCVDAVIVLRCHPRVLKQRLSARGYSMLKIQENLEAEVLDVILCEACEAHEKVYEIDTSNNTPLETLQQVVDIIEALAGRKEVPSRYQPGGIDWLEEIQEIPYT